MKNSKWKQVDELPGGYTQLRLFPPSTHEILIARINELEAKLERQRKSQFGKIGDFSKRVDEVEYRLQWIENGLCKTEEKSACEILEMVGQ